MVRGAANAGWQQDVIVGTDTSDRRPEVGGLPASHVHPLIFGERDIDFPLPGMSDVMPYPSSIFSKLTSDQLDAYRHAWRIHVQQTIVRVQPDLIHSHHIWLLSSMLKDIATDVPIVTSCHATGLRQMALCPHLTDEVKQGCVRIDRFVTLHHGHAATLSETLKVSSDRITVVGGGFNEDLFHSRGRNAKSHGSSSQTRGLHLLYAGKYSRAKGLPWLLDAFERLAKDHSELTLHIAGSGAGEEADTLRQRMETMKSRVILHGQVDQPSLAKLMQQADVFVLPSFYEGLPLVLVEAAACGCQLVATALPGIVEQLAAPLADSLDLVDLPRLQSVDEPVAADLPTFVDRLVNALESALDTALHKPPASDITSRVKPFTWHAVYGRIESVWKQLVD